MKQAAGLIDQRSAEAPLAIRLAESRSPSLLLRGRSISAADQQGRASFHYRRVQVAAVDVIGTPFTRTGSAANRGATFARPLPAVLHDAVHQFATRPRQAG